MKVLKKYSIRIFAFFVAAVLMFTSFDTTAFAEYIKIDSGTTLNLTKTTSGWTYRNNMQYEEWHGLNIYNTSSSVTMKSGKVIDAGTPVYCLQFSAHSPSKITTSSSSWDSFLSTYYPSLPAAQKTGATLALIYGFPNFNYGDQFTPLGSYSSSRSNAQALQVATQMILWEYLNGYRSYANGASMANAKAGLKQDSTSLRYYTAVAKWGGNLQNAYLRILDSISKHNVTPSFNGTTLTLPAASDGTYTASVTDNNNVMNNGWWWYTCQIKGDAVQSTVYTNFLEGRSVTANLKDGGTITVTIGSGNVVTATASQSFSGTVTVSFQKFIPDGTNNNAVTDTDQLAMAIGNPGSSDQQITAVGTPNVTPVYAYLYLKVGETPPYVQLRKTDASTGNLVAGAQYQVYTNSSCTSKATTTDGSNAVLTSTANSSQPSNTLTMKPGTYYVKEIYAPTGYGIDPTVYTVRAENNATAIIDASDITISYGEVKKVDAEDPSKVLAGAVYDVYSEYTEGVSPSDSGSSTPGSGDGEDREDENYKGTTYAYDAVTGERAVIRTTSTGSNKVTLTPGKYYLKEVTPPSGYELDEEVYEFTVTAGQTAELTLSDLKSNTDEPSSGRKQSANTSISDNNPCYSLAGAEYEVYCTDCGTKVGITTTDEEGQFSSLPHKHRVFWYQTTYYDANGNEAGTKVYYHDVNVKYNASAKEITPAKGFALCTETHTFVVAEDGSFGFDCDEEPLHDPFALKVQKADADTGEAAAQGWASLRGAIFQVDYYANTDENTSGDPYRTWYFQTGEDGMIKTNTEDCLLKDRSDELYYDNGEIVYPVGTYRIYEIQPPLYYQLSGTLKFTNPKINGSADVTDGLTFVIADKGGSEEVTYNGVFVSAENLALTAYDIIYRGSVNVMKYDSDGKTPLEGVSFKLVGDDGKTYTGVSDSNGNVLFEDLIPQHYVLTETATVDGHQLLKDNIDIAIPLEMSDDEIASYGADKNKAVWDEVAGAYCFYDVTYEVSNSVNFEVPMTGGNSKLLYAGLIAAFAAMGIGVIIIMKRRKAQEEN